VRHAFQRSHHAKTPRSCGAFRHPFRHTDQPGGCIASAPRRRQCESFVFRAGMNALSLQHCTAHREFPVHLRRPSGPSPSSLGPSSSCPPKTTHARAFDAALAAVPAALQLGGRKGTSGLPDFSVPAGPRVGSLPIVSARANPGSDGSIQFQERVGRLALAGALIAVLCAAEQVSAGPQPDAIDPVVVVHIEGSPQVVAALRPGYPGAATACAPARVPSES
jgi:hypothetical protein